MRTIVVVLDTNVVVSAHLKSEGYERHVLDLALQGRLRPVVSDAILVEYKVLLRPKFLLNPTHVNRSLSLLRNAAQGVNPRHILDIAQDPADNRFLECAEASRADFLVTGNKCHFPNQWKQTAIVNARELLEWIVPELQR